MIFLRGKVVSWLVTRSCGWMKQHSRIARLLFTITSAVYVRPNIDLLVEGAGRGGQIIKSFFIFCFFSDIFAYYTNIF